MKAAALRYAGGGIRVFPVNGKEPLTTHGFHDASSERAQVETWWKSWPEAGIATPDFDVVDVDLYKPECRPTWERIRPLIPEGTPQTRTGGGGLQFIFQAGTLKRGRIGPGVDSRYAGSNYVLLPPSPHPKGGSYEAVVDVLLKQPKPAPEFPRGKGSSEFKQLREQMDAGQKILNGRNTAAWWRAVEILRTLPADTELDPVERLVQSWVNTNCVGELDEVDVPKQVRGAAAFVVNERETVEEDNHWTPLADVVVRPIVFLEKPFLQAAAFHLLAGVKNAGKGTYLAHLAARFTRGEFGPKRHVLWIALGEDSYSTDVSPRIEAAGGDKTHATVWTSGAFILPESAADLERKATQRGDVGMIVLDPLGGAMQAGKSSNFDSDVRPALQVLNQLADTTQAIVFGVRHISIKTERRRDGALAGILGSSDWVNIPRVVLSLLHDDVDKATRHLHIAAGNRVQQDTPGLMLRIEGHLLEGHEHPVTRMRVLGESAKDPDELLAAKRPRQTTKTDAAKRLILEVLHGCPGQEMESDGLDAEIAERAGLAAQTIRNIRGEMRTAGLLRPRPQKDADGKVEQWFVALTGAGIAAAIVHPIQNPLTHNLRVSGLSKPETPPRVSVSGERGFLGEAAGTGDLVTPPDDDSQAVKDTAIAAAIAKALEDGLLER